MNQSISSESHDTSKWTPVYLAPLLIVAAAGAGRVSHGLSYFIGALLAYMSIVFFLASKKKKRIQPATIVISLSALVVALCFSLYIGK